MLSLAKVGSHQASYYFEAIDSALAERLGVWHGKVATELGLEGEVRSRDFEALLLGVDPRSGDELRKSRYRVRVAAFDCTYAAPKSVSVLAALGRDEVAAAIVAAHDRSVTAAMDYLASAGAAVRHRTGGKDVVEPARGTCEALFLHRTSRASDPHLHTHAVLANLSGGEAESWRTLDARSLYFQLSAAGALYRAQLRFELTTLGACWRLGSNGYGDLIGIPHRALRAFSQRSAEIRRSLEQSGHSGPKAAAVAADRTRSEKDMESSYTRLRELWHDRAEKAGLCLSHVESVVFGNARFESFEANTDGVGIDRVVDQALRSLDGPFVREDLLRRVCTGLVEGAPASAIVQAIDEALRTGRVVSTSRGERHLGHREHSFPSGCARRVFASPRYLALQAKRKCLVGEAVELESVTPAAFASGAVKQGIYRLRGSGDPFSDAVRLTSLGHAAPRAETSVVGVAPTVTAAAHCSAVTGIGFTALGAARCPRGGIVLVVEEERLSVTQFFCLLEEARRNDAALVMIGPGVDTARNRVTRTDGLEKDAFLPSGAEVWGTERLSVNDTNCLLARDVRQLVGIFINFVEVLASRNVPAVIVCADNAMRQQISVKARAIAPSEVNRARKEEPLLRFFVLGAPQLMERTEVDPSRRIHGLVAPCGSTEQQRFVLRVLAIDGLCRHGAERVCA